MAAAKKFRAKKIRAKKAKTKKATAATARTKTYDHHPDDCMCHTCRSDRAMVRADEERASMGFISEEDAQRLYDMQFPERLDWTR